MAFFAAYLRDEADALGWLQGKEIEELSAYVTLEAK